MYDIAIIGAGPAGTTAAIYAARYCLKTLLISPDIGGWAKKAHRIENDPGFVSIMGKDLALKFEDHIRANNIDYRKASAKRIETIENRASAGDEEDAGKDAGKNTVWFKIITNESEYEAKFVIFALGTKKRKLNVRGEDEYLGRGVALCATCDAPFFRGKSVAVIGGNDSGATSALLIAEYADKVTVVEMMDRIPCEPIWLEKMKQNPKIDIITSDTVKFIDGNGLVSGLELNSGKKLDVEGVFIEVGSVPDTGIAKALGAETDRWGHIIVDRSQMSSIDRFYAAGDSTDGSNYMRQIVAAQAEGAVAAQAIYKRIMKGE